MIPLDFIGPGFAVPSLQAVPVRHEDPDDVAAHGFDQPFTTAEFDFVLRTRQSPAVAETRWTSGSKDDPDPTSATESITRLRLAIGRLNRRMRVDSSDGLPPLQTSVLVTLEEHAPLRLSELARREGVTPPTMSRALATLDEAGLLAKRPDPSDARSTLIELSDEGRVALARVRAQRTEVLSHRLARLTPDQRAALERALPALKDPGMGRVRVAGDDYRPAVVWERR